MGVIRKAIKGVACFRLAFLLLVLTTSPAIAEESETPTLESKDGSKSISERLAEPGAIQNDGLSSTDVPAFLSPNSTESNESVFSSMSAASVSGNIGDNEMDVGNIAAPVPDSYEFTGAVLYTIPIKIPPGRNGIQPKLNLTYNSYKKNGWIGVGWDLGVSAIQRSTRKGVDYNAEDFVVIKDGYSAELVARADWGPDYYGARIEAAFTKYYFNPDTGGWEAYAKDGTKYFYGSNALSRKDNARGIFKWCLDKVEDTNGNFMEITYYKDQGQIYLDEIFYTGNGSLAPSNHIKFHLIDRDARDTAPMHGTNAAVITAKLLNSIDVQANGERVRTYQLNYSLNLKSYRSVLTNIQQYGSDADLDPDGSVTSGTALPSTDLTWFEGGDGTFIHETTTASIGKNSLFADVNGDGLDDLIKHSSGVVYTYLSIGGGEYDPSYTITAGPGYYVLFADVNGDGKADLVKYDGSGWVYTFLSNGNGTYGEYNVQGGAGGNGSGYVTLADVSGDGKADLIKHDPSGWVYTFLSNGDGTYKRRKIFGGGGGNGANRVMFADINGDGRADLIKLGNNGLVYTFPSNGDGTYCCGKVTGGGGLSWPGFVNFGDINGDGRLDMAKHNYDGVVFTFISKGDGRFVNRPANYGPGGNGLNNVWFADVNGDGRADLIKRGANGVAYTSISNGSGTYKDYTTIEGPASSSASYVHTADVDGEGRFDIIKLNENGSVYTFLSNGDGPSDHLRSVVSPYGATSTIDYTPSSEYPNALMPFIIYALSSLEIDDGLGNISTSTYSYSGGLFDFPTREFRGFERVVQTRAAGTPYESVTETKFHQDDFLKGRRKDVALIEPSAGELLSKISLFWEKVYLDESENTAAFVKLSQERIEYYDRETVYTQQDYSYDDSNGNLLAKMTSGTIGENVTAIYEYENFGDWLWRRTREAIDGSTSGTVRETFFGYEETTGNLLSKQFVLVTGANPEIRFEYDEYGNLTHEYDANGNPPTVISYDSTTRTFPETITNPLGHVARYLYDYRYGKVKEGVDANSQRTYFDYDEFGRIKEVDYPPYPDGGKAITDYHDDVFPRYRVVRIKEDPFGSTIDSYIYFDGLSREIQTITLGENNQAVVTKTFYDAMGRKDLVEGPFFESSRDYVVSPPSDLDYPLNPSGAYPWKQTTFDHLSRPEAVESANGEYGSVVSTYDYSGLSTTVTGPDGTQKTETRDHLGRIVEVIEHAGEENISTTYDYNAAGDLLQVKDHYGSTTTINYDTLGRKMSMTDPDVGFWKYTYDANGNLVTQTDAILQTITFSHDAINRITSKTYSTEDPPVSYIYDNGTIPNGIGRLYSVSNANVTTTYDAYDEMGNVISISKSISGDPGTYTTQYTYDLSDKVTQITYPDGYPVTHTYYPGTGLLKRISGGAMGKLLSYMSDYTPDGKIGRIEYGNSIVAEYAYDPESTRLLSLVTHAPQRVYADFSYTSNYYPGGEIDKTEYVGNAVSMGQPLLGTQLPQRAFADLSIPNSDVVNGYMPGKSPSPYIGIAAPPPQDIYQSKIYQYTPAGNIKEITDEVKGITYTYSYDKLHRLTGETNTGLYDSNIYTYDDIGNILSKTIGPTTMSYTYDSNRKHAVKTITVNGVEHEYEYDDNGNMLEGFDFTDPAQIASRSMAYNADNMPDIISRTIAGTESVINFAYDGDGVRAKKTVNGDSTTYYIGDHYEITDGKVTKYVFAGNLRIAMIEDFNFSYFHKDHLGSSTVMTEASGNIIESIDYMPFGAQRNYSRLNPIVTHYRFTDQELDVESGLYNYNARLYDPVIGRFVSPDTIVPDPFDPQHLNRYSYVRNNPLIYVDPSGHHYGEVEPGGKADFGGETVSGRANESLSTPDDNGVIQDWGVLYNYNTSLSAVISGDVGPICLRTTKTKLNGKKAVIQNFFTEGERYYSKTTIIDPKNPNTLPIFRIYAKGRSKNDFSKLTPEQQKEALNQLGYAAGATAIFVGSVAVIAETWPALMVTAGTPQGQKALSMAYDFVSAAVPSISPAPNLSGLAGQISHEAYKTFKE